MINGYVTVNRPARGPGAAAAAELEFGPSLGAKGGTRAARVWKGRQFKPIFEHRKIEF